ncbi:MAG: hypothetical protein H0U41_00495 [Actinobacteria bacterium]|nr:hypothetical protein [Actinomycetota bacterium]
MRLRRALECLVGVPAVGGNKVDILRNGDQAHPAMLEAISAATSTIDIQTYGHWTGAVGRAFARAMIERAGAGVRVRVLLDAFGKSGVDEGLLAGMDAAGVEIAWFRPLIKWRATESTHRGHRKNLVCDGKVPSPAGGASATGGRGTLGTDRNGGTRRSGCRDRR